MTVRLLHAADLHLDSPLVGLSAYEGAPVERLRGASRRALEQLVRLAVEASVDVVLVAGDVYDGPWRDANTGLFFQRQLQQLTRAGIRVVLLRGNHDAQSVVAGRVPLPPGVDELPTDRPGSVLLDVRGEVVAVHGQGFATREVHDDLSAAYPPPVPGAVNVGLLHTSADDASGVHASYAPCSVASLVARGYDYWALGHVHEAAVLHEDPWVVFAGVPQGRHAKETGPKGCYVVDAEPGHVVDIAFHELDVLRWHRWRLDVTGAASGDDAVAVAGAELERRAAELDPARAHAVRVELTGRCDAHRDLVADPSGWRGALEGHANAADVELWLEKVVVATEPDVDLAAVADDDGPVGELVRTLRLLPSDDDELAVLLDGLGRLPDKLPLELRGELAGGVDLTDPRSLVGVLDDVAALLVPRLVASHADAGPAPTGGSR